MTERIFVNDSVELTAFARGLKYGAGDVRAVQITQANGGIPGAIQLGPRDALATANALLEWLVSIGSLSRPPENRSLFLMRTWSGSYVEPRRWHLAALGWWRTGWDWLKVKCGGRARPKPWDDAPP